MVAYYNEFDPKTAAWLRELIRAGLIAPGDVDDRPIQEVKPDDLLGYIQCHFFAGIGGWSYALRLAGWPDDEPVWTGSCPCQPFSVAGQQRGVKDARHLWSEWFRLIGSSKPATVFGEQVAGAIRHGWLDGIVEDLESSGYSFGSAVLSASSKNASHKRDRLWFVADTLWDEQPRQEPRSRQDRRMGWEQQLFPWDGGWPAALARFRAMGDGVPRWVAGTDGARNAIVPQVAAEFISAYLDAKESLHNGRLLTLADF
jgi:DNA (cytosine-5)-methyltransferase 1